jgi:siroheme synthase-like protein
MGAAPKSNPVRFGHSALHAGHGGGDNAVLPRTVADRQFEYFPAFLDLVGKEVVVVGGGDVAASKVQALMPCGLARLVVVAPVIGPAMCAAVASGSVEWRPRDYADADLSDAALAFGASEDRALNAQVAVEARRRGIPVLAVDDVPNCDFIAPAIVRRGELTLAISTHGRSPALARRAREWLDRHVPGHWGGLLRVAATVRQRLGADRAQVTGDDWQVALDGAVEDLVRRGETGAAADVLERRLRGVTPTP